MHQARFGRRRTTRCTPAGGISILGLLAVLAGCGGEPFSFVPVSGKITYSDGSLIPGQTIVVRFVPLEAQTSGKDVSGAATGYLNPQDGTFTGLTTHTDSDGVVPGRYKVVVMAVQNGPQGTGPTAAVPPRYQSANQTPLEVEVNSASREFELTIEKPR